MTSARDGWSAAELPGASWVKSSYSGPTGGNCVEVAVFRRGVAVRDSRNPSGVALVFGPAEWDAFLGAAKDGGFG